GNVSNTDRNTVNNFYYIFDIIGSTMNIYIDTGDFSKDHLITTATIDPNEYPIGNQVILAGRNVTFDRIRLKDPYRNNGNITSAFDASTNGINHVVSNVTVSVGSNFTGNSHYDVYGHQRGYLQWVLLASGLNSTQTIDITDRYGIYETTIVLSSDEYEAQASYITRIYYQTVDVEEEVITDFRFVSWADSRDETDVSHTGFEPIAIRATAVNPAFTIFEGDLCYNSTISCVDGAYEVDGWKALAGAEIVAKTFVTRGNHEGDTIENWRSLWDFQTMATTVGATNYAERGEDTDFSFDYGNSHFVTLDNQEGDVDTLTSDQIIWLDNDMTNAETRMGVNLQHIFVFWHSAVYSVTDTHRATPSSQLITVINNHPLISAMFFGHEHVTAYIHVNNTRARVGGLTVDFEEFINGRSGAPSQIVVDPVNFNVSINALTQIDVSGTNYTVKFIAGNGTILFSQEFNEESASELSEVTICASGCNTLWSSGSYNNVSVDDGDHDLKVGVFSDNFDDNTNESWTQYSPSSG
ncbi:MAG: metallophosphoesterase, partial [Candidatus Thorarchaeota archaeon]|nr:metallophosphoesterase [Candidatus Thorarchaeota archaeon]